VRFAREDLFDDEALPGGADLRMAQHRLLVLEAQELVQEPAVPDVDPGRFDLTLLEVCVPGLELADHEGVGQ
jgi:hypothetical protein